MTTGLRLAGLLCGLALVHGGAASVWAQPAQPSEAVPPRQQREQDLRALEDALAGSAATRERLEQEIAQIRSDRAKLGAALVDTTRQVQATETRVRALEARLQSTDASESAIRRSLEGRRGVIVEILAALQRMGRRPPPAVLAPVEDVLAAVRAAMLLGAVLPGLRSEAQALADDLAELVRLKELVAADRDALRRELAGLHQEQARLAALVEARQSRATEAERSAANERERASGLAGQARTLKELIERSESEIAAARRAATEAQRATEAQSRETQERFAAAAFRDPTHLAPKIPFAQARGILPRPVSGDILRAFGTADGYGGTTRGISIGTRARALVSSPTDGWVVFAGPFRSFGRLLIINAGGGYHLLLAGMESINVDLGQFVLAGEPVGTMGEASMLLPGAGAPESKDPVLYVEFRKDGGSIDPGPWWAKSQGEKVRG